MDCSRSFEGSTRMVAMLARFACVYISNQRGGKQGKDSFTAVTEDERSWQAKCFDSYTFCVSSTQAASPVTYGSSFVPMTMCQRWGGFYFSCRKKNIACQYFILCHMPFCVLFFWLRFAPQLDAHPFGFGRFRLCWIK